MLTVDQISNQIAACVAGRLSLNAFEDWFRDQSRNAHLWGNENVNEFVDAVESVFSEKQFEKLSERDVRVKLKQEAQRFASPFVSRAEQVVTASYGVWPTLPFATAAALVVFSVVPPTGMAISSSIAKNSIVTKTAVIGSPSADRVCYCARSVGIYRIVKGILTTFSPSASTSRKQSPGFAGLSVT